MPYVSQMEVPFRPTIDIVPAGCIHWPQTDKELLNRWVEELKTNPNAVSFLCGDQFEFARTRYRSHLRSYTGDENSPHAVDNWVERDIHDLAARLDPVKDKILGVIEGNHFHRFLSGQTSDQKLCEILGVKFLGVMGLVRLALKRVGARSNAIERTIDIYLHHSGGSRGGRTHGGDLNTLVRQAEVVQADVYILSHTHDTYGKIIPVRRISSKGLLTTDDRAFIRSGCFRISNGGIPSTSGEWRADYEDAAAYPPRRQGWCGVHVDIKHACGKNKEAPSIHRLEMRII